MAKSFVSIDVAVPKKSGYYLMFDSDIGIDSICRMYYDSFSKIWRPTPDQRDRTVVVTHWCKLPKLPKVSKET